MISPDLHFRDVLLHAPAIPHMKNEANSFEER
jgi:hypothetical protein